MVAISAISHGLAYAGLTLLEPPSPRAEPDGVIEISIEPALPTLDTERTPPARPEPDESVDEPIAEPAAIAPVQPVEPVEQTRPEKRQRPSPPPATAAPAPTAPAPAPVTPAPTATPTASAPSMLSMRSATARPQADVRAPPTLDLSPGRAAAAIVAADPSAQPQVDGRSPLELPNAPRIPGPRVARADGPMVPDGNGTFSYDHAGFTAKVARDGRVALRDKPSFQPFVEAPSLESVKRDLAAYADDPSSGRRLNLMALLPKVGVRFDITDYVMRKLGQDPYNHAKAKFLDETRDQREKMWHAESEERLREALQTLPAELAKIWAHKGWSPAERRRVLFDLWDECAETGAADRVRLGKQIRVTILAFIRKHLPAGSEHAYGTAELQTLNGRRTSSAEFAPYNTRR